MDVIAVITDPQDLAASGEGRLVTIRVGLRPVGSKLREITYLSPYLLREMSTSPRRSLGFQISLFPDWGARRSIWKVHLPQEAL